MLGIDLQSLPPGAALANMRAQELALPEALGEGGTGAAKTAESFEALLATMIVKEMRQTLSEGFFGDGPGADTFGGWLDTAVGESLSDTWQLDLAGMVKTNIESKQARLDAALQGAGGVDV